LLLNRSRPLLLVVGDGLAIESGARREISRTMTFTVTVLAGARREGADLRATPTTEAEPGNRASWTDRWRPREAAAAPGGGAWVLVGHRPR
jgi:hypothetical protein